MARRAGRTRPRRRIAAAACAIAAASVLAAAPVRADEVLSAPMVPVPEGAAVETAPVAAPPRRPAKLQKLALDEFVQRALQAAPELEVARWDVAARQAKLDEAKASRFLPQFEALNLLGLAPVYKGTVLDPKSTVDTSSYGPFTSVEVSLVQPLYTFGKLTAGVNAATPTSQSSTSCT